MFNRSVEATAPNAPALDKPVNYEPNVGQFGGNQTNVDSIQSILVMLAEVESMRDETKQMLDEMRRLVGMKN